MIDEIQIDVTPPFNDHDLNKPFTGDKLSYHDIKNILDAGVEPEDLKIIVLENRHVFLHNGYKLLKGRR